MVTQLLIRNAKYAANVLLLAQTSPQYIHNFDFLMRETPQGRTLWDMAARTAGMDPELIPYVPIRGTKPSVHYGTVVVTINHWIHVANSRCNMFQRYVGLVLKSIRTPQHAQGILHVADVSVGVRASNEHMNKLRDEHALRTVIMCLSLVFCLVVVSYDNFRVAWRQPVSHRLDLLSYAAGDTEGPGVRGKSSDRTAPEYAPLLPGYRAA